MGFDLIAEGTNIDDINTIEFSGKGEIRVFLSSYATEEQLNAIEQQLLAAGVEMWDHVYQTAQIVFIRFRNNALPTIASAVHNLPVVGWKLFKESIFYTMAIGLGVSTVIKFLMNKWWPK